MDMPIPSDALTAATAGPTRQLARFAAGLTLEAIDPFARRAAIRHVIDTVGAMVAGSDQDTTLAVERALAAAGVADGPVGMPGVARRYDALHAAYVGGTSGHGLELDDGNRPGSVHPGCVVVPAVLALTALRGCTGDELLRAVVVGYEAMCRIAAASHPRARWRGFHNTGITGVFGAAAACGSLLGFDAERMEHAFGIAASSAAGLFSFLAGGDVKRTHPGHAAREGLQAALLAEAGLPGPANVLEFKEGFFNAFAGGDTGAQDYSSIDLMAAGDNNPKSRFAVANCYMKPYASCRHIHAAIDAVLDIRATEDLAPDQVAAVRVGTYGVAASHASVGWTEMTTAQMSFPFTVAIAVTRGRVTLADFGEAERTDPAVLDMAGRIAVSVDAECDADYPRRRAAKVELTTRDGRVFHRYVPEPYGAASNPLSDAALDGKFNGLAAPRLGTDRAAAALRLLWGLEGSKDLRPLLAALQPQPSR